MSNATDTILGKISDVDNSLDLFIAQVDGFKPTSFNDPDALHDAFKRIVNHYQATTRRLSALEDDLKLLGLEIDPILRELKQKESQ